MAAKHQEVYQISAGMQALCNLLRSQNFASQLKLSFKSEAPIRTGMWYMFQHGVSFSSWGEDITITLIPLAPNLTQVTILSECGMPTQIVDWGKNRQIVNQIHDYLEIYVCREPAPQSYTQAPPAQTVRAFCYRCGAPITPNMIFCPKCGTRQV